MSENKKVKFSRGATSKNRQQKTQKQHKSKKKLQQPLNRHTKKNDNSEPERKPRPPPRPPTAAHRAHTGAPPETRQTQAQRPRQRPSETHRTTKQHPKKPKAYKRGTLKKPFLESLGPILAESDCLDHRHSFSCVGGFNTRG